MTAVFDNEMLTVFRIKLDTSHITSLNSTTCIIYYAKYFNITEMCGSIMEAFMNVYFHKQYFRRAACFTSMHSSFVLFT